MISVATECSPLADLGMQNEVSRVVVRITRRVIDEHVDASLHTYRHALRRPKDGHVDAVAPRLLERETRRAPEHLCRGREALARFQLGQLRVLAHDCEGPYRT